MILLCVSSSQWVESPDQEKAWRNNIIFLKWLHYQTLQGQWERLQAPPLLGGKRWLYLKAALKKTAVFLETRLGSIWKLLHTLIKAWVSAVLHDRHVSSGSADFVQVDAHQHHARLLSSAVSQHLSPRVHHQGVTVRRALLVVHTNLSCCHYVTLGLNCTCTKQHLLTDRFGLWNCLSSDVQLHMLNTKYCTDSTLTSQWAAPVATVKADG